MESDLENAISLEDLFFRFSNAASGFSLAVPSMQVRSGERVAIIGPSGSGKSTLLGLICGVLQPNRGKVTVLGERLDTMSARQRDRFRANNLGIIFQQFNLLPYLSITDNVALALEFSEKSKLSPRQKRERASHLLSQLGLNSAQMADQRASQLSVGQQQRVAAARAFAGNPRLIIADEPTSALDEGRQKEFLDLLFTQQSETNATLLMITHDHRIADSFDRVLDITKIIEMASHAGADT